MKAMKKTEQFIYFDLESQLTAEEVGGWDKTKTRLRKFSVAVAFSTIDQRLHIFSEKDIAKLMQLLQSGPVVVGYNIKNFDFEILSGYPKVKTGKIKCLDLMLAIQEKTGQRVSLTDLREANFFEFEPEDYEDSITLWKKGMIYQLIEQCCNDVLAMKQIHELGRSKKKILVNKTHTESALVKVSW